MVLWIGNDEAKKLFAMEECIEVSERVYKEQGEDKIVNREPPRTHIYLPTSKPEMFHLFKSTDGGVPSMGTQIIRVTSDTMGWKVVNGKKRRLKFPSIQGGKYYCGLYFLFNNEDGAPLAMFQDAYINWLGVGARVGVGVKYLARPEASTLGLFGGGWYARAVIEAVNTVRPLKRIKIYTPTQENRRRFAEEVAIEFGIGTEATEGPEAAVRGSDIVVTMTNSATPVFDGNWLEPGCCVVSCAGGDPIDLREELDHEALRRADITATGVRAFFVFIKAYPNAVGGGLLDWNKVPQLGEIIAGKTPGRTRPDQIALFFQNLPGGAQHCGMATQVYEKAKAAGLGKELPDELFLQTLRP